MQVILTTQLFSVLSVSSVFKYLFFVQEILDVSHR